MQAAKFYRGSPILAPSGAWLNLPSRRGNPLSDTFECFERYLKQTNKIPIFKTEIRIIQVCKIEVSIPKTCEFCLFLSVMVSFVYLVNLVGVTWRAYMVLKPR